MTLRAASFVLFVAVLSACASDPGPSEVPTASAAVPTATATASAIPTASATASASVAPSASATSGPPGGFTVMPNPDADALFIDRDDCENVEDGYRLEFPDAWYTNTEIGDVPACSWFSPTFYVVDDPAVVPAEIAITIELERSAFGTLDEIVSREEVVVGATQQAVRVEVQGAAGEGGFMPTDWREYAYVIDLGLTDLGPNLFVRTNTDMGGDYELNKAVLDRIMATIEFIGTVQ